jgi:hypothetical protein
MGLDDRGSILGRGNGFSSCLYVQTSSETRPPSYAVSTRGSFPPG